MKRNELQYQTVKPILRSTLERLMEMEEFRPFRLVGGTSLSLRYGHRMSDDIDLFTDAEYGSLDFHKLQDILRKEFPYCQGDCGAYRNLITLADKLTDITLDRVIRNTAHRRALRFAAISARQCQLQFSRSDLGVLKKHFIEIAETVHQDILAILILDFKILLHHRSHSLKPRFRYSVTISPIRAKVCALVILIFTNLPI